MQGVTTAIVIFIFACIAYPTLVKNRPQFYVSIGLVLLIILLDCIGQMVDSGALRHFTYAFCAILQIGAILLLVLSTGGKTLKELSGDLSKTIEVVRRGGESETILVPRTGEQPKPRSTASSAPSASSQRKPPDSSQISLD